ncbi:hypothetical protein HF200_34365, partial [Streptomyces galbus]|nr:hypothetical protein [Streptomyces galbus]
MIAHRPRAALLAVLLLLTGCGGGTAASPGPAAAPGEQEQDGEQGGPG